MSAKGRILVVDDEAIVLESVSRILSDEDYEVVICNNGQDALDLLKNDGFDVLLTDLKMPGLSGLDTMKELRDAGADVSVIMVTAYPAINSAVEAMKLGAKDYIPKPFTPEQLSQAVDRVMSQRQRKTETDYMTEQFEEYKGVVASTLNLKKVMDLTAGYVIKVLKVKGCLIGILSKQGKEVRALAWEGLSESYVNKGQIDASRIIGELSKSESVLISDAQTDPRVQYPVEAAREGIRSMLSVPLVFKDKIIGMLRLYMDDSKVFTDGDMKFIHGFSNMAAGVIANAGKYQDVKEEYMSLRDDLWDYLDKEGWE